MLNGRFVILSLLLSTTYLRPQQVEATSCSVSLFQLPGSTVDCMVTHGEYAAVIDGHTHPSVASALNIITGRIDANGGLTGSQFVDFAFASGMHAAGLFLTFDLFPKTIDHTLGVELYQYDRFLGGGSFEGLPAGPPANPLDPTARGMGIVTDGTWSFNRVQVFRISSPDNISVLHIKEGPSIPVPSVPEPGMLLPSGAAWLGFVLWYWRKTMARATSTIEQAPALRDGS